MVNFRCRLDGREEKGNLLGILQFEFCGKTLRESEDGTEGDRKTSERRIEGPPMMETSILGFLCFFIFVADYPSPYANKRPNMIIGRLWFKWVFGVFSSLNTSALGQRVTGFRL